MKWTTRLTHLSALLVTAGIYGQAHAGAYAVAGMQVTGFTINTVSGGVTAPISYTAFTTLSGIDNLTNDASLNGTAAPSGTASSSFNSNNLSTFATSTDAPEACVGAGCGVQNDFNYSGAPPTSTFSRSDSLLSGQPLNIGQTNVGANASTIAEVSLTGAGTGAASGQIQLTSSFQFTTAQNYAVGTIGFSFDLTSFVQAWTDATGLDAGSSNTWELSLTDTAGNTLFNWIPNGTSTGLTALNACDANLQAIAGPDQQQAMRSCNGAFSALNTVELLAGTTYNFRITQTSKAQADSTAPVPDPATLPLLGIGLVGLGWVIRRKARLQ